ncbi:MAG: pantoate--beta-alanine ligase [Planctomycetes bacterium]|nr:pantoate--beta-alanine ligase [Planctomycetota bacterium]
MQVVSTLAETTAAVAAVRARGRRIGFVPTMGALHAGHLSLVAAAVAAGEAAVASIFVNPLQFGPGEDLATYPRDLAGDLRKLESAATELVFTPSPAELYPAGFATRVEVTGLADELCGRFRPGHFRGVTTVVAKLFHIVHPDRAYFGAKDYQQAALIRRMAVDLNLGVEVVVLPTVREADGLAMSSRNQRLDREARRRARALHRGLAAAAAAFAAGEREAERLAAAARAVMESTAGVEVQYCDVVDAERICPITTVRGRALLAVAAFVGGVRLIDNVVLEEATA